jgi:ABC-type arginine transport system ATPase subunit
MLEIVRFQGFETAYPRELSGGMTMRVSITCALITRPSILPSNEPFAAIGETTRVKLSSDLLKLWQFLNIAHRSLNTERQPLKHQPISLSLPNIVDVTYILSGKIFRRGIAPVLASHALDHIVAALPYDGSVLDVGCGECALYFIGV